MIVRYAGTALLCVVAAFGAAFLVRRAVDHGAPTPRGTVAADTRTSPPGPAPAASGHTEDAVNHRSHPPRLAAEFAPGVQRITRKRPKPKHKKKHRAVSHSSGSSEPTDGTSTPTYTTSTPTYTPTTTPSAPTTGSSGSTGSSGAGTTHHSSGSGTGTTSIGGSGKGSGTTTIG
ncbi:MAG TPA: hypothetical protein VGL69_11315 [Solirubrobacteraceae bacterium]|jgi:hypothetical protein